jgi:hypothetical protein
MALGDAEIGEAGLERIELPRSAWIVSCPAGTSCLATLSAMSRSARAPLSRLATSQPGT